MIREDIHGGLIGTRSEHHGHDVHAVRALQVARALVLESLGFG